MGHDDDLSRMEMRVIWMEMPVVFEIAKRRGLSAGLHRQGEPLPGDEVVDEIIDEGAARAFGLEKGG